MTLSRGRRTIKSTLPPRRERSGWTLSWAIYNALRPTRFAPRRWKFGLLLSGNVHTPREFNARSFIRCGHCRRGVSTLGLTSHKTPKICVNETLYH